MGEGEGGEEERSEQQGRTIQDSCRTQGGNKGRHPLGPTRRRLVGAGEILYLSCEEPRNSECTLSTTYDDSWDFQVGGEHGKPLEGEKFHWGFVPCP
jgi:hypothetical protein